MQVRVFVAIGVTLSLAPMLLEHVVTGDLDAIGMAKLIIGEIVTGGLIGVLARLFFSGLETLAYAAATFLGLANPFGVEMEQANALPPLATYLTLGATAMIFVSDLHWQIIIGLVDSYRVAPLGSAFDARRSLSEIGQTLGQGVRGFGARGLSFFLVFGDRQFRHRADQSGDAANRDLLHRAAVHHRGRLGAALFCGARAGRRIHGGVFVLARPHMRAAS